MKNILLTVLLAFSASIVCGQEQPQPQPVKKKTSLFFRYGLILSAEVCSTKPKISNPTLTMQRTNNSQYAEVIFQPDKGRSLSMHDFALADASGTEYKCVAVAEGSNAYSGDFWNFQNMDGKTRYRMLFAVPSADGEFTLVFKLFPTKIKELPFKLKSVSRFSDVAEILNNGQLILPEPPPPPPPPEPPKSENPDEGEKKDGKAEAGKENKGDGKAEEEKPDEATPPM